MLFHPTRFWNYMARGYARKPVKDNVAYEHKLKLTASYLTPQDRLLEFGCGTGTTALIHASRVSHIDAIDFSSEMIAIAREKSEKQGVGNVDFNISSIEDWTISDGDAGYDAILGMSILHLVANLDDTLSRVYQGLKPGGYFFSSTVCLGEMKGPIRYLLPPLGALGLLPKILPLTAEALTQQLRDMGFEIDHVWRPGDATSVFIVARRPV